MARGRLISKSLGSSRKFHALLGEGGKLGEFCQILFPLLVSNTDDFGRMPGDAFTVKNLVLPTSRRPEVDFERALQAMEAVGLVVRYVVDDGIYLQVSKFDEHQPNLQKRTKSKFPEIPEGAGTAQKVLSNLTELKRTEPRREPNPEPARRADVLFESFWEAYPRKKAKDRAKRAWDKRRPTDALLTIMLTAVAEQQRSAEWLKEGGKWIPHPATWLNDARWTDSVTPADGLSDTARFNLAASDEAEQMILANEARRTGTHGHR